MYLAGYPLTRRARLESEVRGLEVSRADGLRWTGFIQGAAESRGTKTALSWGVLVS